MARTVVFTRQIGHYHDARYRAARDAVQDLLVISTAGEGAFPAFLARGVSGYPVVRLFESRASYEAAVSSGALASTVARALDDLAPRTVVIAGWAPAESLAALLWARLRRVPVVVMSESQAFDAPRQALRELMKRRVIRLCDAALVGGPTHHTYLAALGMPKDRILLGYDVVDNTHFSNGADAARADAPARRRDLGLPERYILASARFIPKKNLPALVRAYADAVKQVNGAPDLVILGDGEQRPAVEAAVSANIGRIHLLGFRSYEDLPALYGLAEGFVHVPLVEQWGLVVNEAMAAGVPVVVSRPCGAAAAVMEEGITGFLIDPTKRDEISAALVRLFRLSPQKRYDMGRAAHRAIADWSPDRFASGLAAAVAMAREVPRDGRVSAWDEWLLRKLSRRLLQNVS